MVRILTTDESAKNKLLMPLRRLKKRKPIEVCLDLGENHWTNLIDVSDKYKGIMRAYKKRLAVDENAIMSEDDEIFLIEYDCFCH